ncbi:MAG TPA: ABC transporter ATP-binding protein [Candidatus Dormibacteraeota bacterium]
MSTPAPIDPASWRGVAAEDVDELSAGLAALVRARSRRLLAQLLSPYRRQIAISLALVLLETAATLSAPWLIGQAIDEAIIPRRLGQLVLYAAALLVAYSTAAGSQMLFLRVSGQAGQRFLYDLRTQLFRHVQDLSVAFYERYGSGRIIARLTTDIDALYELLATGLNTLVRSLLSVVVIAVILLKLDVRLALVVIASAPVVLLLSRWFRNESGRAYRAVRKAVALVIVHFTESLSGIRAVQSYRREQRNQAIYEDLTARYRDANIWSSRVAALFGPGISLLGRVTSAAVLGYGGYLAVRGDLQLGVLVSFVLYLRQFFDPMQDLSQFYNVLQAAAAALEKISGVMDEAPSVPEPVQPERLVSARGEIDFDGVTFAYVEKPVLVDVSFNVPAGQVVALVGETGAGKSTIARLIARFYDPQLGRVTLDGLDLRSLATAELRRAIVMVTQESFLFSGSVLENIAFGRPDASRDEVEAAARAVGAHDFITALPEGYDTAVRRRGVRLSSGQRQLVAFARAFLADPRVLILDEATSSLDLPTERLVQQALRTLLSGRTAFIIAHRLSTVDIADRIVVVDGGRIVEDGSPESLREGAGRYGDLHRAWLESLA